MPEYDNEYFDASTTLARFERRRDKVGGYSRWMMGRRVGEFRNFIELQAQNIHVVAAVIRSEKHGNKVVCSCGLALPGVAEINDVRSVTEKLSGAGHWNHNTNSVAQVFVIGGNLVCAGCELRQPFDEDDPKINWDNLLAAHADCGLNRNQH